MQATEQKAKMLSSINNIPQLHYTAIQHRMQTTSVRLWDMKRELLFHKVINRHSSTCINSSN